MDVHNPFILVQLILDLGAYFRTCIPSFLSHFLSVVLPGLLREHMYVCGYKASHLWTIVQWIYWPCRYLYKMSSAPPGALGACSLQMTHFTARVPSFGWQRQIGLCPFHLTEVLKGKTSRWEWVCMCPLVYFLLLPYMSWRSAETSMTRSEVGTIMKGQSQFQSLLNFTGKFNIIFVTHGNILYLLNT